MYDRRGRGARGGGDGAKNVQIWVTLFMKATGTLKLCSTLSFNIYVGASFSIHLDFICV